MNDRTNRNEEYKKGIMIYAVRTRTASKKQKDKWDVYEEVYVKNGEKANLLTQASVILDCSHMKVVKSRDANPHSFDEYLEYFAKHHEQVARIRDFIDRMKSVQTNLESDITEDDREVEVQKEVYTVSDSE